jgi:peptide/nickel transport system substrate-binding protein
MSRKRYAAGATVLALGLVAAACGGSKSNDSGTPTTPATGTGGTLVIASAQTPTTLEAEFGVGYENVEAVKNMHATLVRNPYIDAGNNMFRQDVTKFEPELAESWEVSQGGQVFTFKLKKGIKSVAGNELTADDVVYSFERKLSTNSISTFLAAPALAKPSQVEKVDASTVRFTLNRPYEFTFLSMMSNFHVGAIYDSKVLQSHATADDKYATTWVAQNGNYGFGPYELVNFRPGEQMEWRANEGYVHGPPAIKRIIVRAVPETANRAALLQRGEVQIAEQLRAREVVDLSEKANATVPNVSTNLNVFLPINTTRPGLSDPKVRQAIAYAIPYDRIISDVYLGRAHKMEGLVSPDLPGYGGDQITHYTYDPDKARQLLKDAGQENLSFALSYDLAFPDMREVATQITSAAQAAGIKVTLNEMPSSAFQQASSSGEFDVALFRDYAIVQSPPYQLLLFFQPGSPINFPRWEDKEFLGIVDAGLAAGNELGDAAAKQWIEAQRRMQDQVPMIFTVYVDPLVAFQGSVTGYTHRTDNVLPYDQLRLAG